MPANAIKLTEFHCVLTLKFYEKKRTNVCVLLKTSSYVFKKEIKLLIACKITSHTVQYFLHLQTKLELGKIS